MNALVTIEPAPTAGPHGEGHTILTAKRQGTFLEKLRLFGNVRLACRAAAISAQTAYRARQNSRGFALAWDAALLAAREHAEQVLADRAINGVEEAVYYHGEEVARRKRYDSRLLLAHLARLDRLDARDEVVAVVAQLDKVIAGLAEGGELDAMLCVQDRDCLQDSVPGVPSCRVCETRRKAEREAQEAACYDACEDDDDNYEDEAAEYDGYADPEDDATIQRLVRMDRARPKGVPNPKQLADSPAGAGHSWNAIDAAQLRAFEAGQERWWEVVPEGAGEGAGEA